MTPAARVAVAADILDEIIGGMPAERALTGWARRSRFAGSKDRAAVRDHVFDVLRCKRSFGWLGGGESGRALMLGWLRAANGDPETIFTGDRHALAALSPAERNATSQLHDAPRAVRLDVQDWLLDRLDSSLGDDTDAILSALRDRAPVVLRTNPKARERAGVIADLQEDGIEAVPHPLAPYALKVIGETRKLTRHAGYLSGHFEFQDAASQAAVHDVRNLIEGASVLDYCAGGGGKSLALAAYGAKRIVAHDAAPQRMKDLPVRATRAKSIIEITDAPKGQFDLVVCDVPCSGSGAWRRQPDAKWRLTPKRLEKLQSLQGDIIDKAHDHVSPGGHLIYMTCSLLAEENEIVVKSALQRHDSLILIRDRRLSPLNDTDGFYVAVISRAKASN